MKLILGNNSDDTFTYASGAIVVNPNTTTEITSAYWFALYSDINFIRDLRLYSLTVNDGYTTFTYPESEAYVKYLNDLNNYNNKDIDGAIIVRTKAAKKGWSFWAVPIEFTTSKLTDSVYCKNVSGVDISGITYKIYDEEDALITVPGDADINLEDCVKTVIDFEPAFDYEIIGGALRMVQAPDQDVRLWIVGAPDIPAIYGGSKEFASGVNLKFLDNAFEIDGRVSKYLTYNAVNHTSKMRIVLKHPAGLQMNLQIIIHVYRL